MVSSEKITFRLPPDLKQLLQQRCDLTGQTTSEAVRELLEYALVLGTGPSVSEDGPKPAAPEYVFPDELIPELSSVEHLGASAWLELRLQFPRLVAMSEVARQVSQNPVDQALCAELLRIGHTFKLI